MSRADDIRNKLLLQFNRIKCKLRLPKPREITNSEDKILKAQIACYQYFSFKNTENEYGENQMEWLHERMTHLNKAQMELFQLKFVDGLSLRAIAKKLNVSKSKVDSMLNKMYWRIGEKKP